MMKIGRLFSGRGWTLGTSGNFSVVNSRDPLELAITASGVDKGTLAPSEFLLVDDEGKVLTGAGKPSDETLLHLAVLQVRSASSILHTHSVWGTILSDLERTQGGIAIEGYEMLKGLAGVVTHEHREWLPIIENSQDMRALSADVASKLRSYPNAHGFLLRGHGLYTWGKTLKEAARHTEIIEFLLEVIGRRRSGFRY